MYVQTDHQLYERGSASWARSCRAPGSSGSLVAVSWRCCDEPVQQWSSTWAAVIRLDYLVYRYFISSLLLDLRCVRLYCASVQRATLNELCLIILAHGERAGLCNTPAEDQNRATERRGEEDNRSSRLIWSCPWILHRKHGEPPLNITTALSTYYRHSLLGCNLADFCHDNVEDRLWRLGSFGKIINYCQKQQTKTQTPESTLKSEDG